MLATEPSAGREEPAALAQRLGLPLRSSSDQAPSGELLLVGGASGLELWAGPSRRSGRARVDFANRQRGRRSPNLQRAVGRRPGRVIDTTAGFGADAFALAALGHRVLAWERSPIMVALLEDGRRRALAEPDLRAAAERLQIRCGDSLGLLPRLDERPDAVYIDPMYPAGRRPKSALPPLEIQLLRRLVGRESDAGALLAAALETGAGRVVVKRPPAAPALPGPLAASHAGKLARYDVYRGAGPARRQAR
ncbi:MAG: class I SAM-dependent methyltransferase [Myxococcota bacterium]|nr:class I SAM-dependent methyltransferase [Myxococcota bacterium]